MLGLLGMAGPVLVAAGRDSVISSIAVLHSYDRAHLAIGAAVRDLASMWRCASLRDGGGGRVVQPLCGDHDAERGRRRRKVGLRVETQVG